MMTDLGLDNRVGASTVLSVDTKLVKRNSGGRSSSRGTHIGRIDGPLEGLRILLAVPGKCFNVGSTNNNK